MDIVFVRKKAQEESTSVACGLDAKISKKGTKMQVINGKVTGSVKMGNGLSPLQHLIVGGNKV